MPGCKTTAQTLVVMHLSG